MLLQYGFLAQTLRALYLLLDFIYFIIYLSAKLQRVLALLRVGNVAEGTVYIVIFPLNVR